MERKPMSPQRPQRGFTLVELLVVIVIIALLAALITPAVMSALRKAKQTQISTELSQLHSAVEAYKAQYGSYPPSNKAQFKAHLQQVFININSAELTYVDSLTLNNANILTLVLAGYSPDKRRPLQGTGTKQPFFDFKPDRLSGGTSTNPATYTPPNCTKPYVYFDCSRFPTTNSTESYVNTGTSKPYKVPTSPAVYANAKSFQIISAGLDNDYGTDTGYLLNTTGIQNQHIDNVTNFSEGKPLIDYIDK
jgi:prepilin-type N-terminal cleavage/methylation domain-containing protein